MKTNKKGFTIVELVIVIAVVAILASVLIPTFASIIEKAKESKRLQEEKNNEKLEFIESMLGEDASPGNSGNTAPKELNVKWERYEGFSFSDDTLEIPPYTQYCILLDENTYKSQFENGGYTNYFCEYPNESCKNDAPLHMIRFTSSTYQLSMRAFALPLENIPNWLFICKQKPEDISGSAALVFYVGDKAPHGIKSWKIPEAFGEDFKIVTTIINNSDQTVYVTQLRLYIAHMSDLNKFG